MKCHVSDPVTVLLVCSDSMRHIKPAAREKTAVKHNVQISEREKDKSQRNIHVSSRGLQDASFGLVHDQNSRLLDSTKGDLLVLGLAVERAKNKGSLF